MDVHRKIIVLSLGSVAVTLSGKESPEDVTDYRIRQDVIDRLHSLAPQRVIITHGLDEKRFMAMTKAIELFLFVYCRTAVIVQKADERIWTDIPYNMRKTENILCVGDKETAEMLGTDYIDLKEFLHEENTDKD